MALRKISGETDNYVNVLYRTKEPNIYSITDTIKGPWNLDYNLCSSFNLINQTLLAFINVVIDLSILAELYIYVVF
jgi:hypothetical protein